MAATGACFGEHLSALLTALSLSPADFAARAKCPETVLHDILTGRLAPAPSDVPQWAQLLNLDQAATEHFLDLADLARTPTRIAQQWQKADEAKRQSDQQHARELADLRQRISDLETSLRTLSSLDTNPRRKGYQIPAAVAEPISAAAEPATPYKS
jgi:uncharacterized membrane protein YccC